MASRCMHIYISMLLIIKLDLTEHGAGVGWSSGAWFQTLKVIEPIILPGERHTSEVLLGSDAHYP